jgi:ABC-type dipeptide/oligopeptide/nickel transport system permease subunit
MSDLPTNGGQPPVSETAAAPAPHLSPNQRAWQRFKRNRPAVISAWFLVALIMVVLAWPLTLEIANSHLGPTGKAFAHNYDPDTLSDAQYQAPSAQHWMGTDVHGCDLLSRILYGAQVSLLVGAVVACVSMVIGVLWGAVAG